MKNFINVRIEGLANQKFISMLDHNLRKNTTQNQSRNDNNIILKIDNDNNTFQILETQLLDRNTQNNLSENELNEYKNKRHNMLNYREELLNNYNEEREEHKHLYKKRTRAQLKDDVASWGNGIITFSEKIQNDYNNNTLDKEQFYKCAFNAVNEICDKLNAQAKLCVIHFDETCPHVHFMFKNYDEQGKSLSNNYNLKQRVKKENLDKPILESLQDIGAANFHKHFEVKRGESKLLTNHRHKKTQQHHSETIKAQENLIRQNESKLLELQQQMNEDKAKYEEELQTNYRSIENKIRQDLINNNKHLFADYKNVDIEKLSKFLEDLSTNKEVPEEIRDNAFKNFLYKNNSDNTTLFEILDTYLDDNQKSNSNDSNRHK